MEIKDGDVVRTTSGGPWMTVERVELDTIHCVFFLQNGDGAWHGPYQKRLRKTCLELRSVAA